MMNQYHIFHKTFYIQQPKQWREESQCIVNYWQSEFIAMDTNMGGSRRAVNRDRDSKTKEVKRHCAKVIAV